jgi:hypothetical protein
VPPDARRSHFQHQVPESRLTMTPLGRFRFEGAGDFRPLEHVSR